MNLSHLALISSILFAGSALAAPETYRCLETAKGSAKPSFSMGIALTGTSDLGAVTVLNPQEDQEANFRVESVLRKSDHIEVGVYPIGSSADAMGLQTLKIRPSGRAESEATFLGKPVTLSCSRQFL
jgi:hypothetical protein